MQTAQTDLRATMWAQWQAATTRAQMGALYQQWVGYDITRDDPALTDEEVSTLLLEWMAEVLPPAAD